MRVDLEYLLRPAKPPLGVTAVRVGESGWVERRGATRAGGDALNGENRKSSISLLAADVADAISFRALRSGENEHVAVADLSVVLEVFGDLVQRRLRSFNKDQRRCHQQGDP